MFFNIKNSSDETFEIFKTSVAYKAYWCILMYNFSASDKILNRYLLTHYKLNLRTLCFHLLSKAQLNKLSASEIAVTFIDSRDDKLARLITYGTGRIPGSKILKIAFSSN